MIGLFPRTPQQQRTAAELAHRWGPDAVLVDGGPGPALRRMWTSLDAVVLFLPVGAAVRLVAPLLRDERTDPDVVCVDERFAVTLSGGGQAIAEQVAEVLGRVPVVPAGEPAGALDELVDLLSASVDGDLAGCAAAVAAGEPVLVVNPHGFPLPALPENASTTCDRPVWTVVVDDRRPRSEPGERELRIVPRTLVIGIGAVRGVSRTAVTGAISRLDREHGLDPRAIRAFATAEAKGAEAGLLDAVQDLGFWHSEDAAELPLRLYPPEELDAVPVPNPSTAVRAETGTGSVAEAAALRAAAELGTEDEARDAAEFAAVPGESAPGERTPVPPPSAAALVVPKTSGGGVTVAAARVRPRGRLTVVGLGPGPADLRTHRAETEIRRAAAVVGSAADLDRVRDLLHPGAHLRAGGAVEDAAALAAEGRAVALITTGDPEQLHAAARGRVDTAAVELRLVPGVR